MSDTVQKGLFANIFTAALDQVAGRAANNDNQYLHQRDVSLRDLISMTGADERDGMYYADHVTRAKLERHKNIPRYFTPQAA